MFGILGVNLDLVIVGLIFLVVLVPIAAALVVLAKVLGKSGHDSVRNPNLFPCPDCGHQISRLAKACPKCGRPNAT
jgi:hypothetical protein